MAVILVFSSHMDGVCNIIFTLPGTFDYYVQNIVNIRIALSVIGKESICSHLRFSIFSVSAKTEGSAETVRTWSETQLTVFSQRGSYMRLHNYTCSSVCVSFAKIKSIFLQS